MNDDRTAITTDPIEVAWERLQTSEAYWSGYSGMLLGVLVFSVLPSLFTAVITFGMGIVSIVIGLAFTGLVGVIGALIFLAVRIINGSLGWRLQSRQAAATAACLTGLFVTFVPALAAGALQNGIDFGFTFYGPAILVAFMQAGGWLGADRELRKFEQRVAFGESDKVVVKNENRFGIASLLIGTFWLAGAMAIFSAADRWGVFGENIVSFVVAAFLCVFLAAGFSVILVVVIKTLRRLQKRLFYREPRVG